MGQAREDWELVGLELVGLVWVGLELVDLVWVLSDYCHTNRRLERVYKFRLESNRTLHSRGRRRQGHPFWHSRVQRKRRPLGFEFR